MKEIAKNGAVRQLRIGLLEIDHEPHVLGIGLQNELWLVLTAKIDEVLGQISQVVMGAANLRIDAFHPWSLGYWHRFVSALRSLGFPGRTSLTCRVNEY
jgi:hypothetical protein